VHELPAVQFIHGIAEIGGLERELLSIKDGERRNDLR
jgi:hypothetical protein